MDSMHPFIATPPHCNEQKPESHNPALPAPFGCGRQLPELSAFVAAGCKVVCSTCGPLPPDVCNPTLTANDTSELAILRERLTALTTLANAASVEVRSFFTCFWTELRPLHNTHR